MGMITIKSLSNLTWDEQKFVFKIGKGNIKSVKQKLDDGYRAKDLEQWYWFLHSAIQGSNLAMFQLLFEEAVKDGFKADYISHEHGTPLLWHTFPYAPYSDILRFLLDNGADINFESLGLTFVESLYNPKSTFRMQLFKEVLNYKHFMNEKNLEFVNSKKVKAFFKKYPNL
jgi:hypothetical protein